MNTRCASGMPESITVEQISVCVGGVGGRRSGRRNRSRESISNGRERKLDHDTVDLLIAVQGTEHDYKMATSCPFALVDANQFSRRSRVLQQIDGFD